MKKEEIILAIREFISHKQFRQGKDEEELDDEQIGMAAESPMQYNLFDDFFKSPFPFPDNPRTFIRSHYSHYSHNSHNSHNSHLSHHAQQ